VSIGKAAFGTGLGRFAIAARQPLDDGTLAVYFEALGQDVNGLEWEAFTRWAVKAEVFDWIPRLDELTAALAKWRRDRRAKLAGQAETPEEQDARQEAIRNRYRVSADARRGDFVRGRDVFVRELERIQRKEP
jgi:hypothetical protein